MNAHPTLSSSRAVRSRRHAQGLSLIEVMVSLAIGLVVIGAVFANYLNNSQGSRQTAALTQVTNDAALAFGILRNHMAVADYSLPSGVTATGLTRRLTGMNVFGCSGGFDEATDDQVDPANILCASTAGTSDALMVRYEVDEQSVPSVTNTATSTTAPSDCTGNALVRVTDGYFVADSRFDIATGADGVPSLACLGNGNTPATAAKFGGTAGAQTAALVENIAEMHLTYGVAAGKQQNIIRYVSAADVAKADDVNRADKWGNVVSVRICLLVRSAEEVLPAKTAYRGCNQAVVAAANVPDRRIYRAFTSTVVLNNRLNADPQVQPEAPPTP
jgi:type IV pilus assembly protein PilW